MSRPSKLTVALGAVVAVLAAALLLLFQAPEAPSPSEISYTRLLAQEARVRDAVIRGDRVTGHDAEGHGFATQVPSGATVAERLAARGAEVTLADPAPPAVGPLQVLVTAIAYGTPLLLLWFMRRIARALEARRP